MVKWPAHGHKNQVAETQTASYNPFYEGGKAQGMFEKVEPCVH